MASGEADVQPADPPPDLKPHGAPIAQLTKPDEEAEGEPGEDEDESGLEEHGLGLREPLDGVEREYRLREGDGVVDAGGGRPLAAGHQLAGGGGGVVEVARGAEAEGFVVGEGVWRARGWWEFRHGLVGERERERD